MKKSILIKIIPIAAAVFVLALVLTLVFFLKDRENPDGSEISSVSNETRVISEQGAELVLSPDGHFFTETTYVTAAFQGASEDCRLYYTLDGSDPAAKGKLLNRVRLQAGSGDDVNCYTLRVAAKFSDGTWSKDHFHTYFVGENVGSRFDLTVFSLTVLPEDLTGEQGIFTHAEEKGEEWERPVYVEYLSPEGETLLSQNAGIRVHGGWSRKKEMRSLRLYARKEYDPEKKYFDYPIFDGAVDMDGTPITRYKRLVLRNSGNDKNHAFVRDALVQQLAKDAGYTACEECRPVAVFINGEYQGFYWAQEYVGERYFEAHYGDYEGEFELSEHLEGADLEHREENLEFLDLAALDLTDDANYRLVTEQIDVEDYIFNYAINTLIDNEDWPQTNTKSYRYLPGDSGTGDGVFDGRWRWVLHDTDMSFGLGTNHVSRECLKCVLDPEAVKHYSETLDLISYSPLFSALMKRDEIRKMYVEKCEELMSGAFLAAHMEERLNELIAASKNELTHFHAECQYANGRTMDDYEKEIEKLRTFLRSSGTQLKKQIREVFGEDP